MSIPPFLITQEEKENYITNENERIKFQNNQKIGNLMAILIIGLVVIPFISDSIIDWIMSSIVWSFVVGTVPLLTWLSMRYNWNW